MKKVLVVREYDNFSRILAADNFEIINLPLIETRAIEDLSAFETTHESIENYDGVFLTSKQADGNFSGAFENRLSRHGLCSGQTQLTRF